MKTNRIGVWFLVSLRINFLSFIIHYKVCNKIYSWLSTWLWLYLYWYSAALDNSLILLLYFYTRVVLIGDVVCHNVQVKMLFPSMSFILFYWKTTYFEEEIDAKKFLCTFIQIIIIINDIKQIFDPSRRSCLYNFFDK